MEKLSCESRVKWRTTSSSLSSGSIARCLRRRFSGISEAMASEVSRSVGHCAKAPRPGREYSKMIFSGCLSIAIDACPFSLASGSPHGGLERVGERIRISLDVGGGARLGGADQQSIAELGVVGREIEATDDSAARELRDDGRDRAIEQKHGLVEARLVERELHALHLRQRGHELVRACMACVRDPRETF